MLSENVLRLRIAVIRGLAARHCDELDRISDFDARADRLAELNVIEQVRRLRESPIVRGAARRPGRALAGLCHGR
ncbi:hypothetical protein KQH60_06530 [Mycetohabitans sp. B8]|nr:hypothetical protein [Mycetohabitans sp. B8]